MYQELIINISSFFYVRKDDENGKLKKAIDIVHELLKNTITDF